MDDSVHDIVLDTANSIEIIVNSIDLIMVDFLVVLTIPLFSSGGFVIDLAEKSYIIGYMLLSKF